jgi:hypothetical protein
MFESASAHSGEVIATAPTASTVPIFRITLLPVTWSSLKTMAVYMGTLTAGLKFRQNRSAKTTGWRRSLLHGMCVV